MRAYGYTGGAATAFQASQEAAAQGRLSLDRSNIPRGAVLYWDGRANGNAAGHVAIYDGSGYIFSNDVTGAGRVGRVPWDFPETNWHQTFLGWSPPYFPTGVGGQN
jgi:cell wall-associated NlpC family hydrolase